MMNKEIMGLLNEVATRNTQREKEQNKLVSMWHSMYQGLTQGKEDRELMFLLLFDERINRGIGSVFAQLKRWIVENRELDIEATLEDIHIAENNNDIETLARITGEVFLEDITERNYKGFKARLDRQGWSWESLLNIYLNKRDYRVNRLLNIPYYKYIETRKIA